MHHLDEGLLGDEVRTGGEGAYRLGVHLGQQAVLHPGAHLEATWRK